MRLASSSPSEAQVLQRRPTCAILYVTLTWETGYSFQETKSGRHFHVHLISDPQDPWVFPIEKDVGKGALHGHGWDGRCLLREGFMKLCSEDQGSPRLNPSVHQNHWRMCYKCRFLGPLPGILMQQSPGTRILKKLFCDFGMWVFTGSHCKKCHGCELRQ